MKVLFVFHIPSGGVETLNRERSKALGKHGIECHCLYFQRGAGAQNIKGIPTFYAASDAEIRSIVQAGGYQAIVVISAYPLVQKLRQFGYRGIIVYEVQGLGGKEIARRTLTAARPYLVPHASALLNPKTPHIEKLFHELYPGMRKFSFNNGIDTHVFRPKAVKKPADPIVAWIGRIEENKNWREFLQIAHHLTIRMPRLHLWMFEDHTLSAPAERDQFRQSVSALGLNRRLRIRSNVPHAQMADYLSMVGLSGGLLLSTSKSEGAPFAVIEALSCRCPVLTTDSDGVRSAVIPGRTGMYYTQGRIAEGAHKALVLLGNAALRSRLADNGRRHVVAHFSWEQYCRHFIAMLRALS